MPAKEPKTLPATIAQIISDREQANAATEPSKINPSDAPSVDGHQGQQHRPPVARINLGGVQANIWANPSDKGDFHTITFARRYQETGGEWKTSNSYSALDALALSKVADLAVSRVVELQRGRGRAG